MSRVNTFVVSVLAIFSLALAAACSSTGGPPQLLQSPAQIAATWCPSINTALVTAKGLPNQTPAIQAGLADAATWVGAVCNAGSGVTTKNLQDLVNAGLPVIINAVSVLDPAAAPAINAGILLANAAVNAFLANQAVATVPASAPVVTVPPVVPATPVAGAVAS